MTFEYSIYIAKGSIEKHDILPLNNFHNNLLIWLRDEIQLTIWISVWLLPKICLCEHIKPQH